MDLGKTLTRAVCLLSTQLLPMDGATAAGGSSEPAANGSKPEEQQFDPSRSKELPSQLAASFHFSKLFCISSSNGSLVPAFFCIGNRKSWYLAVVPGEFGWKIELLLALCWLSAQQIMNIAFPGILYLVTASSSDFFEMVLLDYFYVTILWGRNLYNVVKLNA